MRLSPAAITCLAISGIYIFINFFTSSLEFDSSNKIARYLQNAGGDGIAKFFFLVITYFGFPVVPVLPVIPLLLLRDKWVPFKITFLFSISGYIIGFLKVIYGGPRPWWVGDGVQVFGQCGVTDFGRPSGHAFISAYAFLLLFKFYIYDDQSQTYTERIRTEEVEALDEEPTPDLPDIEARPQKKMLRRSTLDRPPKTEWDSMKTMWLTIGIILSILIGISRIYLGAHSFEQIFLGWSYAAIFYIFTIYYLDEQTDNLFLFFLDGRHRNQQTKVFGTVTALYILMLTLPLVVSLLTSASREANKKIWVANMLKQCEGGFSQEFPMDSMSLYLCVMGVITFGMIYGMMFAKHNIMLISKYLTTSQLILRKLVGLAVFAVIALVCYYGVPTTNYIVCYLVNLNTLLLFVAISAYTVLPKLFDMMGLSNNSKVEELNRNSDYLSY